MYKHQYNPIGNKKTTVEIWNSIKELNMNSEANYNMYEMENALEALIIY